VEPSAVRVLNPGDNAAGLVLFTDHGRDRDTKTLACVDGDLDRQGREPNDNLCGDRLPCPRQSVAVLFALVRKSGKHFALSPCRISWLLTTPS
jgi:hypothetical protein